MSLYDTSLTGTGTRSYPEVAALRLLVELRGHVGQLSGEMSRQGGSDTMRMAVLKLTRVAGFETSRTAKMRSAYGRIQADLTELAGAVRMAGLKTYVTLCQRVSTQLAEPIASGDVPAPLLDVLYEWIDASLQYLGATPSPESFPEAEALVEQLYDPRWGGLYSDGVAESLKEGLVSERQPRPNP